MAATAATLPTPLPDSSSHFPTELVTTQQHSSSIWSFRKSLIKLAVEHTFTTYTSISRVEAVVGQDWPARAL